MLKAIRIRVQNFRNIDDSGWVPLERVTTFVGRNESGKTAMLKALHKFNPATPEPYNPQREFPRDRYTRDFKDGGDWPVCSVAFEIAGALRDEMQALLDDRQAPSEAVCTRYYDGSLTVEFDPKISNQVIAPAPVVAALKKFASAARRLEAPAADQEEATQELRTALATWASQWEPRIAAHTDLRGGEGVKLLSALRTESEGHAKPQTAEGRAPPSGVGGRARSPWRSAARGRAGGHRASS